MTELNIIEIRELVNILVENKLDRLEYKGLILLKSKYNDVSIKEEIKEDPLKSLVYSVSDNIPDFIKENQHLINANPFRDYSYTPPSKE